MPAHDEQLGERVGGEVVGPGVIGPPPMVGATVELATSACRWKETAMTAGSPERVPPVLRHRERVPLEELARRQGVVPITSTDQLITPGMFDSDDELDEFLESVHTARQAGLV